MPPKFRRRFLKYLPFLKYFLIAILAAGIIWGIFQVFPPVFSFFRGLWRAQTFFGSLLFNRGINLKETRGRTNILILGIAGGNYEGADLTDALIFLSVDLAGGETVMISLPRDIWLSSLQAKINTAYALGEEKRPGGGLVLSRAAVSEILGQPLHYALKIDFLGFEKMIDLLGGVEIEVERPFNDYKYPIAGKENDDCGKDPEYQCRFESLHFDSGRQLMDGERALKYVRSRQAEGEEGTDFARARRQQKLMLALKKKVFSAQTLLNPGKIWQLKNVLGNSLETDINFSQLDDFLKLAKKVNGVKIETLVLDTGEEKSGRKGFLINPPLWVYGTWVLVPRQGTWEEIQNYLSCRLESQDCPQP